MGEPNTIRTQPKTTTAPVVTEVKCIEWGNIGDGLPGRVWGCKKAAVVPVSANFFNDRTVDKAKAVISKDSGTPEETSGSWTNSVLTFFSEVFEARNRVFAQEMEACRRERQRTGHYVSCSHLMSMKPMP